MIRKLNYTGRKKIPLAKVSFRLIPEKGGFSFEATLKLGRLDLPADADVYIEAYHGTSYMRFPYGKVGRIVVPDKRLLDQIESGSVPLFRVMVAKGGRIIAAADKIIPRSSEDQPTDKFCLLPVEFRDLGESVWRLDFLNGPPTLQLNGAIENVREIAQRDNAFLSLVYPEVVRQVLRHILLQERYGDAECDEEDWQSRWLQFAQGLPGIGPPPSAEYLVAAQDREDWIEDVVMAFCAKWKTRERFLDRAPEGAL
jgi:hypothetical protein